MEAIPWYAAGLLFPRRIAANLARVRDAQLVPEVPNLWQLQLGVLRMWHRVLFRSDTVGTCASHPVRDTRRARLLHPRAVRSIFLIAERAMAPLDFSGLASPPWRILRHLLAAHHDADQFVYDLQLLAIHPGWLEKVRDAARAVIAGSDGKRAEWLRDLAVFEGYHEALLAAVEAALDGKLAIAPEREGDPDITFTGYLRWCARQPRSPSETLRALLHGSYTIAGGAVGAAS